jgi:nucleoside-diphosphate-sugar epimerase/predicted glycosyltransferase
MGADQQIRAVVTGAAGFIGSHLCEALVSRGDSVVGIDAFDAFYAPARKRSNVARAVSDRTFTLLPADLNQLDLDEVFQPGDVVFHLAGHPGVRDSWAEGFPSYARNNIEATQRVLEAARRRRVARLVYASSSSVYGNAPLPMAEDGPLRPVSPYGVTKLAAEQLCLVYWTSFGVPAIPLRFFSVYGPRQRPDMAFHRFIEAILDGRPLTVFGDGTQLRDFTFVDDAVRVILAAAADAQPGQPVNVGGGSPVSVANVIAILERLLSRRAQLDFRPAPPGDARDTLASTDRLRALGVSLTTNIEEGLTRQVAWHLNGHFHHRKSSLQVAESAPRYAAQVRSIMLYSHDTYGLGHLRRNLAIAHGLLERAPDLQVTLLTGSQLASRWVGSNRIAVVQLPPAVKVGVEAYEPAATRSLSGLQAERAGIIASTLARLRPEVFLVDHAPLGMKGELRLALEMAAEQLPATRLVLGLRDILDDGDNVRRIWSEQGIVEVLRQFYQRILVYGSRHLFDVEQEYGLPDDVRSKILFTGYVAKPRQFERPASTPRAWRQAAAEGQYRYLVMGGGGGDAAEMYRAFFEAWSRIRASCPGRAVVVTGPLMDEQTRASIRVAAQVVEVDTISSSQNMLGLIAMADVVVAMAGYNTVVETLAARRRLVLCPRLVHRREQRIRAGIVEQLGLARVVYLDHAAAWEQLGSAIVDVVEHPPSSERWNAIDLDGVDRVVDELLEPAPADTSPMLAGSHQ